MRYFKIEPYANKYFVAPDGFSYCKVSKAGQKKSYNFNQGHFVTNETWEATILDNRDSLSGKFQILNRNYNKNGYLYDYRYITVVEELTEKQFSNTVKTHTYMKELVT